MNTKAATVTAWQTDCYPPIGRLVWCWYFAGEVKALWTGARWQTQTGLVLEGVTHWREIEAA